MLNEIGSEYWEADINDEGEMLSEVNQCYTLSGRTSIDFIIKDIKVNRKINLVYMPSYCCHTMIEPFVTNGINVIFYNVGFTNNNFTYDVDYDTKCDVVIIMQYFGFCNYQVNHIIDRFKNKGKIVIEDATHSWFSSNPYSLRSNYVLASMRKWTGVACGSIVIKRDSIFDYDLPVNQNNKYIEIRRKAAELKKRYINGVLESKETFLGLFSEAEELLEKDYQEYSVPEEINQVINKIDNKKICTKRKMNAKYLVSELGKYKEIETVSYSDTDTPLFVPIVVLEKKRNNLRQILIDNRVYCPIHWPISELHSIDNVKIYDNILSIICDQRYDINDMKRIVAIIDQFFGGY